MKSIDEQRLNEILDGYTELVGLGGSSKLPMTRDDQIRQIKSLIAQAEKEARIDELLWLSDELDTHTKIDERLAQLRKDSDD